MKDIGFIIIMMFLIGACSKSEIETWDAKPRAWFYMADDTTLLLFSSMPEETSESIVKIPITMAGKVADVDRNVLVKDLGGSSFNPGSKYEIISAIIPAGKKKGEMQVKVYKTENLNTANDTLSFEIVSSDEFEAGLEDYLHNAIIVSNSWFKPSWWNWEAESRLGYYSEKKLEIIYTVLGSEEVFDSGYGWRSDEVSVAVYKLNRYCIDNNVKYHPDDKDVIIFDSNSK